VNEYRAVLQKIVQEHQRVPELGSVGARTSQSDVEAAERAIGNGFSDSYRQFLLECGSGLVGHLPIYGLQPTAMYPAEGTVVDVTNRFRAQGWPTTDAGPVISTDQSGNPIVEDREGKIVTYDHDFGGFHVVSPTFEAFVSELVKELCSKKS
jgi:hypothetical protein